VLGPQFAALGGPGRRVLEWPRDGDKCRWSRACRLWDLDRIADGSRALESSPPSYGMRVPGARARIGQQSIPGELEFWHLDPAEAGAPFPRTFLSALHAVGPDGRVLVSAIEPGKLARNACLFGQEGVGWIGRLLVDGETVCVPFAGASFATDAPRLAVIGTQTRNTKLLLIYDIAPAGGLEVEASPKRD
jgi:hypothetical protein